MQRIRSIHWELGLLVASFCLSPYAAAEEFPSFDFGTAEALAGWQPTHDIGSIKFSPEGMQIEIVGSDPYTNGPARDYPNGVPLLMHLRIKSDTGGTGQVFYFRRTTSEEDSVRFPVKAGGWSDVVIPLPPLGRGYHLRIDPPGTAGTVTLARIRFERRLEIQPPAWPKPTVPALTAASPVVAAGALRLRHGDQWGAFDVSWNDQRLACGFDRPWIGYRNGEELRWLDVAALAKVDVTPQADGVLVSAHVTDADGGDWSLTQRFRSDPKNETIDVETRCTVSRPRQVLYLPLLLLTPGLGSYGEQKSQALLAGVEYLENEPSSSVADMNPPASERRVPDSVKLTMPLAVVQHAGHYVSLSWEMTAETAALFDAPDRLFRSGASVMGVLAPGSDGRHRRDGDLFPFSPLELKPESPVVSQATIWAGEGNSIVPAVQRYVLRHGLPPLPAAGSRDAYVEATAASWLKTEIRDGNRFRHAVAGTQFPAHPAADAAWQLDWLATTTPNGALRQEIRAVAREAAGQVPPAGLYDHAVGHVRYPIAPLLYGHLPENLAATRERALGVLARFDAEGRYHYRAHPGREDYGRTHWSDEANGLTATSVDQALELACFAGDRELIERSLVLLRKLDAMGRSVPRGAQTWEIPLHTPDILGSAYLVRAFVRGYELTGEKAFLDAAIYWAWTGVPFVYLRNPTEGPIGPYSTIAVLGATNWVAPVWLGLPVQWCGLVYADALRRLAVHDQPAFWNQLANGIALSGVQQVYPPDHPRHGLLPDSFSLRAQMRNPADINPGTLTPTALPAFGTPLPYSFRVMRQAGLILHAPGEVQQLRERADGCQFQFSSPFAEPGELVLHGFTKEPTIRMNGSLLSKGSDSRYLREPGRETGTVILRCPPMATVELTVPQ